MAKKTALYEEHIKAGGNLIEFAGYMLPVNYPKGIISEHQTVRNEVGMFDVSHMGEILVKGQDAKNWLERVMTNRVGDLNKGQVRYSAMCYENGGCVDDLLIYCFDEFEYLLVVNAANKDQDYSHLKSLAENVIVEDVSENYSQLAIQGERSEEVLAKLFELPREYFSFIENETFLISKTGYTGERGYEIYGKADDIVKLWQKLLTMNVQPCGLGCRDTLRFEAGMALYGNELGRDILPSEGGIGFAVKCDKDFIGKKAMSDKEEPRILIGLEMTGRGIARKGYPVFLGETEVGVVTSGTMSPTLNKAIANARVLKGFSEEEEYEVEIRDKKVTAKPIKRPFYKRRD